MKTIVLDDDPTGTQSASDVTVLFTTSPELLVEALRESGSVYVQTNSRALSEEAAVNLARRIKVDGEAAAQVLGEQVRFVLRGDSTLRGHVFAESEVFLDEDAVLLFVPAFPEGGRTTRGGVHLVRVDGHDVPAHESEYAADPVFGYSTGVLADFVAEKSGRTALTVDLDEVRAGGLGEVLASAPAGSVVLPDVVDGHDVSLIARAVAAVNRRVVVRSASPLAAEMAGVLSSGLLARPLVAEGSRVLLVCGSHTHGASAQLAPVSRRWGAPTLIETAEALSDPLQAGTRAAEVARSTFAGSPVSVLATERVRAADHGTLAHGERVMTALTAAVAALLPDTDVVVAKGGITAAEVASAGLGASSARVRGQVLPGVSVWSLLARDGREVPYVVVPGNVGDADTLVLVLDALGLQGVAP